MKILSLFMLVGVLFEFNIIMLKPTIFVSQLLSYQIAPPGQPLGERKAPGQIVSPSSTVTIMVLDLVGPSVLELRYLLLIDSLNDLLIDCFYNNNFLKNTAFIISIPFYF